MPLSQSFPNTGHLIQHYHRQINFLPKDLVGGVLSSYSVHDIIRVNLARFIPLFESSSKTILGMGRQGDVEAVEMPRIYYLDVVVKYRESRNEEQGVLKYLRYTLNSEGIKNVKLVHSERKGAESDDENDAGSVDQDLENFNQLASEQSESIAQFEEVEDSDERLENDQEEMPSYEKPA